MQVGAISVFIFDVCVACMKWLSLVVNENVVFHVGTDKNRITELPSEIGNLSQLTTLYLRKCMFLRNLFVECTSVMALTE